MSTMTPFAAAQAMLDRADVLRQGLLDLIDRITAAPDLVAACFAAAQTLTALVNGGSGDIATIIDNLRSPVSIIVQLRDALAAAQATVTA